MTKSRINVRWLPRPGFRVLVVWHRSPEKYRDASEATLRFAPTKVNIRFENGSCKARQFQSQIFRWRMPPKSYQYIGA